MDLTSEAQDSLWWLTAPIAAWAVHFGGAYALVALGCPRLPPQAVHGATAALTALALLALAGLAWRGLRRYAAAERSSRPWFMGLMVALLSAMAAVSVVYEAAAALLVGGCP